MFLKYVLVQKVGFLKYKFLKHFDIVYDVKEKGLYVHIMFVRFCKCKKKFFFKST